MSIDRSSSQGTKHDGIQPGFAEQAMFALGKHRPKSLSRSRRSRFEPAAWQDLKEEHTHAQEQDRTQEQEHEKCRDRTQEHETDHA